MSIELQKNDNILNIETSNIELFKDKLNQSESFLKLLLNTIPNPVFYKDIDGIYQHCNDSFSRMILGINKELIIGKSLYDLPEYIPTYLADIYSKKDQELFNNPGTQFYEAQVKCADGILRYFNFYKSTFISDDNKVLGLVGVMLDVTDYKNIQKELEDKNEQLKKLSNIDSLTSLYNRRYFEEIFEKKLSDLNRYDKKFAFALVDIDFFKDYNDGYGHLEGDKALKKVSKILTSTFHRPNDFVFRLGGEEFGILYDVDILDNAKIMMNNLTKNLKSEEIKTFNNSVADHLTISVGLVLIKSYDINNKDIKTLIYDEVDNLLYMSKKNGRNQFNYKEI